MPRNVDPNLSIGEEIVAIKTAALIAARLELLRDEGFMGAEAVLKILQPYLRDSKHSIYTLDAIKSQCSTQLFGKISLRSLDSDRNPRKIEKTNVLMI